MLFKMSANEKTLFEILKMRQNICQFNKSLEKYLETQQISNNLCESFQTSEDLNKFRANNCVDFKMCKTIVRKEDIKRKLQEDKEKNSSINGLSQHLKNAKLKCDFNECNKSYKTKQSLTVHQRLHTGIKFVCIYGLNVNTELYR
jgi:phosphoenolpyruvate carboxylase